MTPSDGQPPKRRPVTTTEVILANTRLARPELVEKMRELPPVPRPRPRNRAPWCARRPWRDWRRRMAWIAAAALLVAGLYMRLANLDEVQQWAGDSGRDYLMVMEWGINGNWPLLGPSRITGDFTFAPGWFYTIAPALMLSGYHVAAGAATVGVIGMLGYLMAFLWLRRATASVLAAAVGMAFFVFGAAWVEYNRVCWNPYPLPAGLMAMTLLIHQARRHPLPSLALFLMLEAMLPQWHTTGLSIALAAPPFFAWSFLRGRGRLAHRTWRGWMAWGVLVAAFYLFCFVPPVIYEMTSEDGNIGAYLDQLMPGGGGRGDSAPWTERLAAGAARLSREMSTRNFGWFAGMGEAWHWRASGLQVGVVLIALVWRIASRRSFAEAPAVLFLISIVLGFWFVVSALGNDWQDYFGQSCYAAPILLTAWGIGVLLRTPRRLWWLRYPAALLGLAVAGLALWQVRVQAPAAWNIHRGHAWHGYTCREILAICDRIHALMEGRPYSLKIMEPGEHTLNPHYQAMLWRAGNRPVNHRWWGDDIEREAMGEVLVVVARDTAARAELRSPDLRGRLAAPLAVRDAVIWRIYPGNVPADATRLRFRLEEADPGRFEIVVRAE